MLFHRCSVYTEMVSSIELCADGWNSLSSGLGAARMALCCFLTCSTSSDSFSIQPRISSTCQENVLNNTSIQWHLQIGPNLNDYLITSISQIPYYILSHDMSAVETNLILMYIFLQLSMQKLNCITVWTTKKSVSIMLVWKPCLAYFSEELSFVLFLSFKYLESTRIYFNCFH